jgi:hypothetical protein
MPSTDLGLGVAPLGTALYGYGAPTTLNSTVSKLFLKEEDLTVQANSPAINTKSGDFIRDPETGIHRGMDSVQQMVYLALRTAKNSSLVPNFGINRPPKVITDGVEREIQQTVQDALSDLILRRLVELISVEVQRIKTTGLQILVNWRNLTNSENNTFRITL